MMDTIRVEHPADAARVRGVRRAIGAVKFCGFASLIIGLIIGFVDSPSETAGHTLVDWLIIVGAVIFFVACPVATYLVMRRVRSLNVPIELHRRWNRLRKVETSESRSAKFLSADYDLLAELVSLWKRLDCMTPDDEGYHALDAYISQEIITNRQSQPA